MIANSSCYLSWRHFSKQTRLCSNINRFIQTSTGRACAAVTVVGHSSCRNCLFIQLINPVFFASLLNGTVQYSVTTLTVPTTSGLESCLMKAIDHPFSMLSDVCFHNGVDSLQLSMKIKLHRSNSAKLLDDRFN